MKPIYNMPSPLQLPQYHQKLGQRVPGKKADDQALKAAATDFEALFIQQMLKTMRDSVSESKLLPQSEGEKIFKSMLDEEYAQVASKTGDFGLGASIYEQMKGK